MKKQIALLVVFALLLSMGNANVVFGAKSQMIRSTPMDHVIDIDDGSYSDHFYALQANGTVWTIYGNEPAVRGPQVKGAVKISGNLILTSTGEVWTWNRDEDGGAKRIPELSDIKEIAVGPGRSGNNGVPAYMALNDKGQVYVWGNACFASLMRPDFQDREVPLCYGSASGITQADMERANTPVIALDHAKAIRGSIQSLMVLLDDGKTINRYGNIYLMDYGMEQVVTEQPVADFAGFDTDGAGYGDVRMLVNGTDPGLPKNNFRKLSVSYEGFYSLYLDQDGSVWGKSDWLEGSVQKIQPLSNITEVHAVAYNSGTALDKNGIVWTWGNRNNLPFNGISEKFLTQADAKPVQRQLSLKIDGEFIPSDPSPIQMNGVTFVPVRALFESIGAQVSYANDLITVHHRGQVLKLKVYDTKAEMNGKTIQLPAAPLSYKGRTFVPVRFLAQILGAKVLWDAADGCVVIQLPDILE